MQGNAHVGAGNLVPRSLVRATDIDVLPADRVLLRRDAYWVVRSPSNPGHYWGNVLIFDRPPEVGDGERWPRAFATEFPELGHCTLAWDGTDGALGAAAEEFPGFILETTVGLLAAPGDLRPHPRANREVTVSSLRPDADAAAWAEIVELWESQQADDPGPTPPDYRAFAESRLGELRELFRRDRGAWFVARDGDRIAGSLGVVVTGGRARFQAVDTRREFRGRGIASRLVGEAAAEVARRWPVERFVIGADPEYHALGIYESLGFVRVEQVSGLCRWPGLDP